MSHPSEPTFTIEKRRRTPALTARVRELFEASILSEGWTPGRTIPMVAVEVGLTPAQVRDAIFAPAADEWRAGLTERVLAARRAT